MSEKRPMEKLERRINSPERAIEELKTRVSLTERQEEVFTSRKSGETFTAIAKRLGITPPAVRTIYLVAEKKIAELERTISCPHCTSKIRIYDAL